MAPALIDLLITYRLNNDLAANEILNNLLSERVGEWGFSVDFKN
jgi:hypothetical protein